MKNKNFLKFAEILESKGEEEAYKFACECQKKETEKENEEKFSEEEKSNQDEIADLKKQLQEANEKISAFESSKETEKKEMKIRRVKETFKKFNIEPSQEVLDVYLVSDDKKFDSTLTSLEASLKQGMQETKATKLTTAQEVQIQTNRSSEANIFGVKQEVLDEENKLQEKAIQFRRENPKLTVPESRELARKSLGITG